MLKKLYLVVLLGCLVSCSSPKNPDPDQDRKWNIPGVEAVALESHTVVLPAGKSNQDPHQDLPWTQPNTP